MKSTRRIALIMTLCVTLLAKAQDKPKQSYTFSLDQAIAHAIEHNYSAINAQRDITKAQKKKWETTAAGLPQISGKLDVQHYFELPISVADINGDGINEEFVFGTRNSANAVATLNQLIFDGSYIVALQASKTYLKYYENAKQKSNVDVREMVINAYGNVLLAEESIAILNRNKTTLEKTLNDTRETFKNGLIEEENVEQLEITLASVNSSLNNTTRLLDIAYKNLKITLGIDLNDQLTLTDKLENLTTSNVDMALAKGDFNVNNNIDYQMALNFQQQRQLEYKLERSKALPSLSAFVNYGSNAYSAKFPLFDSDQRWYNSSLLGVSLNVPIFSSLARTARTQQAKIAFEQASTQLIESEQRIKLQYEQAKSQYEFSIEEYATQKNNLRLAERIERKQQVKFTEGLSSSFDFSEAQRQLYTAQQSYLQSMVDIINTKAALEKVTNNSK
ncbi:TolC family protein [Flavobacterium sp.]|uniref:TolC family protein n=1 Tax=Flavobacterium sp. TaxID=239 RepID=UPI0039E2A8A6